MNSSVEEIDPEMTVLKKRRLDLLNAKTQLLQRFGLLRYQPHDKQHEFHSKGECKLRAVFAGNRFGKTTLGAAEDCAWLLGYRPWYPEGSPFRFSGIPRGRKIKGLVIAIDFDKVEELWTGSDGKIWRMIPKDEFHTSKNSSGNIVQIIHKQTGNELHFDTVKSWKGNRLGAESSNWDFIHVAANQNQITVLRSQPGG